MPMFELDIDGTTTNDPFTWCRVKIERVGKGSKKDIDRYRFLWAFDTMLGDNDPLAEHNNMITCLATMDERHDALQAALLLR